MNSSRFILIALSLHLASLPAIASADDTPATQPTLITLHVQDADAREVLKRIADRAGLTTEVFPPWLFSGNNGSPITLVTLDMDHEPFWQAMGEFCKAAHCRFMMNQGNGTLQIQQSFPQPTQGNLPDSGLGGVACVSGSYVIVAQSIQRSSSVNLDTGQRSHNDSIQLIMYADPGLKILGYSQPVLDAADDENGHSMLPEGQPHNDQVMNQAFSTFQVQAGAMLNFPPQAGLSLVNLSGTWDVKVPTEMKTLTIDDVSEAVAKTAKVDNYSMTITSCQLQGINGTIAMTVNRTPAPQPSPVVQGLSNMIFGGNPGNTQPDYLMYKLQGDAITLVDADGKSMRTNGGGGGSVDQVQWQVNVFAGNQPGWGKQPIKLVWKIPTQTTIDSAHFQFKNLPLPQY